MSIIRNITPAVAVMVAGLAGAYLVYDQFFTAQNGVEYAAISPAAGESTEDTIIIAEAGAPVVEAQTTTEATVAVETAPVAADATPAPAPNCDTLQAAVTAAMGTAGLEKAEKDLAECVAAKASVSATTTTEATVATEAEHAEPAATEEKAAEPAAAETTAPAEAAPAEAAPAEAAPAATENHSAH